MAKIFKFLKSASPANSSLLLLSVSSFYQRLLAPVLSCLLIIIRVLHFTESQNG